MKKRCSMYEVKVQGVRSIQVYASDSDDAMRAVKRLTPDIPSSARKMRLKNGRYI